MGLGQVIVISHRGYEAGEDDALENNPIQVKKLLDMGIDVEIDVSYNDGRFFLGHDSDRYEVDADFLKQEGLWCHAKSRLALEVMLQNGVHCFWHQQDDYTLTSRGIIWAYPSKQLHNVHQSVLLFPENISGGLTNEQQENLYAVCTDFPFLY